ncbi:MAG: arylsulfatase A-like enzyme [Candidatus Poriferisodalaceae bacterium]|jgi:arylsulfatase A-like enzyme
MVRSMNAIVDHVLFLVADEWRADALGVLGTPGVFTPRLNALAAEGVTFSNHWCQASPCGPSRASLLTGTYVATHQQWTNSDPLTADLVTMAAASRAAGITPDLVGYTDTPTGVDGQIHDPAFNLIRPFFWQLGFPEYRAHLETAGYGPLDPEMMGIYPIDGTPGPDGLAPSAIAAEESDVAWLTDAAIEAVRRAGSNRTMLHVNWLRPHPPFSPPSPYHRLIDPDSVALPGRERSLADTIASHPYFAPAVSNRSMTEYLQRRVQIEDVSETDERHLRAAYYGHIAEIDVHVGRLVDELKASGRYESTLIVFLSDHGDALGDQWLYGRRGPFDGHFKVPCIIRDPRASADGTRGTQRSEFTANVDIMPTILEALGVQVPEAVEGVSLEPMLFGLPTGDWRTHVRYDMDWTDHGRTDTTRRFSAIRTASHRWVEFNDLPPMLFDLTEDPFELTNRADDQTLASTRAELTSLIA